MQSWPVCIKEMAAVCVCAIVPERWCAYKKCACACCAYKRWKCALELTAGRGSVHKSRSVQRCMNPNPRHSQCTLHANEHTALLIAQCTCSVCVTTDKTLNKNWCVRYNAAPIHKCSVCEARVWSNARLHTAAISKSFGRRRGWRDKSQIWPSLELFPSISSGKL